MDLNKDRNRTQYTTGRILRICEYCNLSNGKHSIYCPNSNKVRKRIMCPRCGSYDVSMSFDDMTNDPWNICLSCGKHGSNDLFNVF